jgi:hypothetical protein
MGRKLLAGANPPTFGSDASIDNFSTASRALWTFLSAADPGTVGPVNILTKSDGVDLTPTGWQIKFQGSVTSDGHILFVQDFATTDGTWITPDNSFIGAKPAHLAVSYDRGSTANDPDIYIDGALQAELELGTPLGASNGDAAEVLTLQSFNDDDKVGWLVYDDQTFTAADVNRHRWWGVAPGGPSTVAVWHPMWTSATGNKGTASADLIVGDSQMIDFSRVERMYGSMMGVGR